MGKELPQTEVMTAAEGRRRWSEMLNRVFRREARMVIERNSLPVAALVSMEDLRRLEQLDQTREARFRILEELNEAFEGVSVEELERQAAAAIAQLRGRAGDKRAAGA